MRKRTLQILAYFVVVAGVVLLLHQAAEIRINPMLVVIALLGIPVLLLGLVRFPTVFVAPVLFVPREKEIPILSRFDDSGKPTALAICLTLLAAAVVIRLVALYVRRRSIRDTFRGQGGPIAAYLVFAGIVAMSLAYTPSPVYGGEKLLRFVCIGVPLFLSTFVLFIEETDFVHFSVAILVMGLVFATERLVSSTHASLLAHGQNVTHIGIGQLIGMAILITVGHAAFLKTRSRFAIWFLALWLGAGLVGAEARGPLVSLIFALGASVVIGTGDRIRAISARLAVALAVIGLTAYLLSTYWFQGSAMQRFTGKTAEIVQLAQSSSNFKGTAGRRLIFYRAALNAFADEPLAGRGVGGWSNYYFHTDDRHYPHNLLLEVAVEEGLLGLIALAVLLVLVVHRLREAIGAADPRLAVFLLLILYSLSLTMFSGDLDDNRFLWFWCGAGLAACQVVTRSQEESGYPQILPSAIS